MSSDISNDYWTDIDNYEDINDKYMKKIEILTEPKRVENNIEIQKYKNLEYNKEHKKMIIESILDKYTYIYVKEKDEIKKDKKEDYQFQIEEGVKIQINRTKNNKKVNIIKDQNKEINKEKIENIKEEIKDQNKKLNKEEKNEDKKLEILKLKIKNEKKEIIKNEKKEIKKNEILDYENLTQNYIRRGYGRVNYLRRGNNIFSRRGRNRRFYDDNYNNSYYNDNNYDDYYNNRNMNRTVVSFINLNRRPIIVQPRNCEPTIFFRNEHRIKIRYN